MDFPPTFVINLPDRTDRLQSIRDSFGQWPVPVERIEAVRAKPGWKGCLRSHKKVLEMAKQRDYEYIIVLEDDCILTPKGKETFLQLLPILKQRVSEWDVFMGGVTLVDNVKVKQKTPPLFEVKCYTTHFCFFNKEGIKKVLQTLNEEEAYDVFLRKNVRIWCTVPHIALQKESHSDIVDSNTNYTEMFQTSTKTLEESNKMLEGFINSPDPNNKSLYLQLFLLTSFISVIWLVFPLNRAKPFR